MIIELIITALFTVGIVYFMSDDGQVWVVVKDGGEYKPILKHRKDLGKDEEYSTEFSAAFKAARRKNFWKSNKWFK